MWCFAIVNNKLAEIYFDKKKNGQNKIWGHCYVKKGDYKTKQEQKWIAQDTKKVKVVYGNKKHKLITPQKSKRIIRNCKTKSRTPVVETSFHYGARN